MSRIEKIKKQIIDRYPIEHLDIIDFSHQHRSHFHSSHTETHLEIHIVSTAFDGIAVIQRHRKIQQLLKAEFEDGLHALTLSTLTPDEWTSQKNA